MVERVAYLMQWLKIPVRSELFRPKCARIRIPFSYPTSSCPPKPPSIDNPSARGREEFAKSVAEFWPEARAGVWASGVPLGWEDEATA